MSKRDFFVELLVEEIPARFQTTAIENFSKIFCDEFSKNQIQFDNVKTYITPRRMVFSASLEEEIAEFLEEKKGPQTCAPKDVIEKFLKPANVSREQCTEKTINNKTFIFVNIKHEKRKAEDLLGNIVKNVIFALPWPKSMHWGNHSFNFVRPLRNILCLFNEKLVNVDMISEINLCSTNYTFGHRFMANKKVFVNSIDDYLKKMREAFVIVDQKEREKIILDECNAIESKERNLKVDITKDLLEEVVGLVEYPVVMMGNISEKFMRLPDEVITTTMRSHQRYFPTNIGNKLAPYFVFVANNIADDGGKAIKAGNERVLSARLSDALFFFENDLTTPLERHLDDLKKIAFNEKLGTVYDRTLRIQSVCELLCDEIGANNTGNEQLMLPKNAKEILKRAALLAKCDLATSMVCEFTELQGIMGAHYACFQGESEEVCDIIRDQYKMVDDLYSPLCALYSMADKIDAITSLFAIGKIPTGSKDPFALRRAAIGIVKIIMKYGINIDLRKIIEKTFERLRQDSKENMSPNTVDCVITFIADRLRVVLKEDGIEHDVISSVMAVPQDIQSMQKKAKILNAALKSEIGEQVISIYKRAKNIVQGNSGTLVDESLFIEKAEKTFFEEIKDFEKSMIELEDSNLNVVDKFDEKLKCSLNTEKATSEFFTNVLVNANDEKIQKNRIGILAQFVAVFNRFLPEIANF